jgi:predicted nucleotidyltransferase
MKAREGDFLKDLNGIIFDVKGLVHPPNEVVAFPRFIPEPKGTRMRKGVMYNKIYNISARFKFLKKNSPNYIIYDHVFDEKLCEVPSENVKHHYKPSNRLQELRRGEKLDRLERIARDFLEFVKDHANVSWNTMGISGSLLAKLHMSSSDIDPIVYGSENCRRVYSALQGMRKSGGTPFKPYTVEDLKALFAFRSKDTQMDFEDFVAVESRKVLQGMFSGKDYFIRFVKDWNEINEEYGDVCYKNSGYARIEATIADDSESIFTPCVYRIENIRIIEGRRFQPIQEIASFRGRFCEQARTGDVVVAQGKVEHVTDNRQNREYFRLLLGNKPSDCMILA